MVKYRTFVLQTAIGRSADNIGLAIDHLQQNQDCPLTSHQPHRHHVDRNNFDPSRQNSTINSIVIKYQPSIQWPRSRYQRRCSEPKHRLWYRHHPIEVQISWQSIPSPVKMDGIQWARYRAHWMPSIPLDLHLPGSGSTTEKRERPTTFRKNQTRWWFEIHQKSDPSEVWSFYVRPLKRTSRQTKRRNLMKFHEITFKFTCKISAASITLPPLDASTCSSIFWRNSIVSRYLPLTFCGRPAAFAVARRTFCGQLPSCATTASRPHSRKVSFKDSSCSAMAYPQTTVSRHVCLTNSMQLPKASQSILCLIHCHYCSGVSTDTPLPLRIKTLCNISLETLSFILSAQTNA